MARDRLAEALFWMGRTSALVSSHPPPIWVLLLLFLLLAVDDFLALVRVVVGLFLPPEGAPEMGGTGDFPAKDVVAAGGFDPLFRFVLFETCGARDAERRSCGGGMTEREKGTAGRFASLLRIFETRDLRKATRSSSFSTSRTCDHPDSRALRTLSDETGVWATFSTPRRYFPDAKSATFAPGSITLSLSLSLPPSPHPPSPGPHPFRSSSALGGPPTFLGVERSNSPYAVVAVP